MSSSQTESPESPSTKVIDLALATDRQRLQEIQDQQQQDADPLQIDTDAVETGTASSRLVRRQYAKEDDPNPRKRPRQRYTEEAKKAVVQASVSGERETYLQVAAALGMHSRTADNLVSRHRNAQRASSGPKDGRGNGKGHPGAKTKMCEEDLHNMQELLHIDCCLTEEQLRTYINKEKLRRLLVANEDSLGLQLKEEERERFAALDEASYLKIEPIKALYQRESVRNTKTIASALHGMVYTTKAVVYGKSSMNTDEAKQKRLKFCLWLRPKIDNPERCFIIVFDEMPFYLSLARSRGRAPQGRRAMARVPPVSALSLKTTVAMAVSERYGLLLGESYIPQLQQREASATDKRSRVLRACYHHQAFKTFLNNLLRLLFEKREELRLVHKDEILILVDDAPEHGKRTGAETAVDADLLRSLENIDLWKPLLDRGLQLRLVFLPPNSPTLNLCEYYNRTLRTTVNVKRGELAYIGRSADTDAPHGEIQTRRLELLKSVIDESLAQLQRRGPQTHMASQYRHILRRTVEQKGFIDMQIPN